MIDAGLIVIIMLALGILLARHWPQPMVVDVPNHRCGFMPPE
jgi:hypothetical protein